MKTIFWYKTCPFCNQGRLFVFKNLLNNFLYLHCEECESGYPDLESTDKNKNRFLTLLDDFDSISATEIDIRQNKWDVSKFIPVEVEK